MLTASSLPVTPERFEISVPRDEVTELRRRLADTRYGPDPGNADWSFGVPAAKLREWVTEWRDFDWPAIEAELNGFEHYRLAVDGVPIHFLRCRSAREDAIPLMLLHGWPWTFWDYRYMLRPLADPSSADLPAFDVIVPSLPGFAYSTPVESRTIGFAEMGDVLTKLMTEGLGFDQFAIAGGDFGALVAAAVGHAHARHVLGIQLFGAVPLTVFTPYSPLNMPADNWGFRRPEAQPEPALRMPERPSDLPHGMAHVVVHWLEGQTLANALYDSPAGLMSWLLYLRQRGSDHGGDLLNVYAREFLLTTISLYWFTESIGSTFRRYSDMINHPWQPRHDRTPTVESPTSIAFFDGDHMTSVMRPWVVEHFNLARVTSHERGGHFSPAEKPGVCVAEIQETFRRV